MFNGVDGEYSATIAALSKKGGTVRVTGQTQAFSPSPPVHLYFAPVKRTPTEYIIQKATEIGVHSFRPVLTDRTTSSRLNVDRLGAIGIEAAEQCGRLDIPTMQEASKLNLALEKISPETKILFCDEAGDDPSQEWGGRDGRGAPVLECLQAQTSETTPWIILTGPEGGFSAEERLYLRAHPQVVAATLGPRILRADTAAIAALVLWQAAIGDWQGM